MGPETAASDDRPQAPGASRLGLLGAILVCALCLGYTLYTSHRTRNAMRWWDFKFLYLSGECWLDHQSPYNNAVWQQHWRDRFSYIQPTAADGPAAVPWMIAYAVPLALLPYEASGWVFDLLNVTALGICLWSLASLVFGDGAGRVPWRRPRLWLAMGACGLVSGVPAAIYVGQTTLFALAGALGLLVFLNRRRWLPAVACALLTTLKPPVAVLWVVYGVLASRGRALLALIVAGAILAAVAGPSFVSFQPLEPYREEARASWQRYMATQGNVPPRPSGMYSLLWKAPIQGSPFAWMVGGLALAAGLGGLAWRRDRSDAARPGLDVAWDVAILAAASGMFLHLKEYDSAIFLPAVALAVRQGLPTLLALAPGLILACRPENAMGLLKRLPGTGGIAASGQVMTIGAIYVLVGLGLALLLDRRGRGLDRLASRREAATPLAAHGP